KKLLDQHARLMAKERKVREAYGPLAIRWSREFSGLIAFPAPPAIVVEGIEEQLDGLLGKGQWSIDQARWSNAVSVIVPKANPRHAMARMLCEDFRPRRMTNEVAHIARLRLGRPTGLSKFPWESEQEALMHHVVYRHFRDTDPRTKVVSRL